MHDQTEPYSDVDVGYIVWNLLALAGAGLGGIGMLVLAAASIGG